MRKVIQVSLLVATVVFYSCTQTEMKKESKTQEKLNYPVAHKVDTVDKYFGVEVPDPYRWMENDTTKEVADWVKKQNELTFGYLEKIPFRDSIKARLTELWDFEKESAPFKRGGKYFYYRNDGLQNQSILYVKDSLNGEAKVFIDPNKLSDDGTVSLAGMGFSTDGKKMAYSIARGGSDWNEIFVKDVETGELLSDHIEWVKFSSIAWFKDGFFYSRYDKPVEGKELSNKNEYHKIYYHVIGDSQSEDKLVFENPDVPLRTYYSMVTEDEKYLVIYESGTTHGNALLFKELDKGIDSELYTVVEEFTHEFSVIGNIGTDFYIKTNLDAPRYKLVKLNLDDITKPEWEDVIPQNENVLGSCGVMGGKLFVSYMKDAHSVASVFDLDGKKLYDVELPGIGSLGSVSGKTDESEVFYSFSSFTIPSCVYRYDIETNQSEKIFEPSIDIDLSQYETKQVFYKSKDGTEIPMFICYKKGIELNGDNPTLLYGYGGFNISLTPSFRIRRLVWLENGGIYVNAHIRGGGEYGEEWHEAGTKLNKQNVFDDFIAAGEYLIENKYTNPSKLAVMGGSNGGLLVGAVANQRPDLFKVAIPAVGVMDMLRFHKFTIGWSWVGDYGSSDDSIQFNYIHKYSPIHNIKSGVDYPAIMVTTADHDDRVVPAHSFKYIATLQEKHTGPNPTLIRIEVMAGHGAGKPTAMQIQEYADIWSFIFYNMGIDPYNK